MMTRIKPEDRLEHIRELQDQLAASQQREAELSAHVERLRSYLIRILEYWTQDGNNQELFDMLCHIEETVKAELAATPAQSLARLRNEALLAKRWNMFHPTESPVSRSGQ